MNRFTFIALCALTLVLSACGIPEPLTPVEEETLLEPNQLEINIPEVELPGCTLPAFNTNDLEFAEAGGCIFLGCTRYEAKLLE
jgi:hypothetical protein